MYSGGIRNKMNGREVSGGKGNKLFDMVDDLGERNDLIESTDPAVVKARKKLEAVVKRFPSKDGVPQYDPTPPQAIAKS